MVLGLITSDISDSFYFLLLSFFSQCLLSFKTSYSMNKMAAQNSITKIKLQSFRSFSKSALLRLERLPGSLCRIRTNNKTDTAERTIHTSGQTHR